jgi:phage baseplate assembly protein W
MQGYSPKLPLIRDPIDGAYSMNKTLTESVKQNFKMLLLTNPGERIMNPDFGAGIRKYLFSQESENYQENMQQAILNQTRKYLKFIRVDNILFGEFKNNSISMSIHYSIPSLSVNDQLNISLESN